MPAARRAAGPTDGVAVVTGGNRGLGAAIAAALADDGHNVVVTWRSTPPDPGAPSAGLPAVRAVAEPAPGGDLGHLLEGPLEPAAVPELHCRIGAIRKQTRREQGDRRERGPQEVARGSMAASIG